MIKEIVLLNSEFQGLGILLICTLLTYIALMTCVFISDDLNENTANKLKAIGKASGGLCLVSCFLLLSLTAILISKTNQVEQSYKSAVIHQKSNQYCRIVKVEPINQIDHELLIKKHPKTKSRVDSLIVGRNSKSWTFPLTRDPNNIKQLDNVFVNEKSMIKSKPMQAKLIFSKPASKQVANCLNNWGDDDLNLTENLIITKYKSMTRLVN